MELKACATNAPPSCIHDEAFSGLTRIWSPWWRIPWKITHLYSKTLVQDVPANLAFVKLPAWITATPKMAGKKDFQFSINCVIPCGLPVTVLMYGYLTLNVFCLYFVFDIYFRHRHIFGNFHSSEKIPSPLRNKWTVYVLHRHHSRTHRNILSPKKEQAHLTHQKEMGLLRRI